MNSVKRDMWEEEFDQMWGGDEVPEYKMFCKPDEEVGCGASRDRIKDFIRSLLEEAKAEERKRCLDQITIKDDESIDVPLSVCCKDCYVLSVDDRVEKIRGDIINRSKADELLNRDKENKPSKKTEWETELDKLVFQSLKNESDYRNGVVSRYNDADNRRIKEFIHSLLHQRDNEIREWVDKNEEEMELSEPDGKGKYHRLAVKSDDLLTYLSKDHDR